MNTEIEWSIRDCSPQEVELLLALWREAEATPSVTDTVQDVERMISTGTVLVAEAESKLVGSIIGVFDGWRANIYRLAVHPSHRRRGIARTLVAEIEKRLLRQGAKRFSAIVEVDHPWATAFWAAVGYAAANRTVRYTRNIQEAGQRLSKAEQVMAPPLFTVDAFTDQAFSGNPAAVCLLPGWREDRWLQAVAREMNLSETAFLVRQADYFDLRWFTPKVEVDLCGHATLASAHILWQHGQVTGDSIRFSTRSGILKAIRHGDDMELDFPLKPEAAADAPAGLLEALGISAKYVGKNQFDYLVEVESEAVLRAISPDFKRLATVPARGIIVTSKSADSRFDFVSRFFAPAAGIDEDPVTGSAHCCLGDFWRKRLGTSEFVAFQASARGGVVKVRVTKDRAFLGGKAITVAKGAVLVEEDMS